MPDYMSAVNIAAKWGVSKRRVALLCEQDRVPGAFRIGVGWVIPTNAEKPADARIKSGKYIKSRVYQSKRENEMNEQKDLDTLSKPFKALIGNKRLNYQLLDLFPFPIEIFTPDGISIFMNRAYMELNSITDASLVIGKYNLKNDPVCIAICGKEAIDKAFRGESFFYPDFPVPIQDLVDRGVVDKKPYEAATMDVFILPIWDGDIFTCSIMIFALKHVYRGRVEIANTKKYIDEHWLEEYDGDAVARAVNVSSSHLYALFRSNTGMTIHDYYRQVKVEHIKEKLADINLSIAEAFSFCGEDSRGTFARVFKELSGMTPRGYRNNLNK